MLEQTQSGFLAAVRGAPAEVALGASAISHAMTWQVYRRNYVETHVAALAETYSTVRQTVGQDFFRQLAKQFVHAFDSHSGDLNDYGARFASFIEESVACDATPYLADLARLDWAWFDVLRSSSVPGNWLMELLALPSHCWPRTSVRSAGRCIASVYPIYAIWQLATGGAETVSLDQGGQTVLISRTSAVAVTLLSPAAARFTQCWLGGSTLELALEAALALDPELDISALLRQLSSLGAIESLESRP